MTVIIAVVGDGGNAGYPIDADGEVGVFPNSRSQGCSDSNVAGGGGLQNGGSASGVTAFGPGYPGELSLWEAEVAIKAAQLVAEEATSAAEEQAVVTAKVVGSSYSYNSANFTPGGNYVDGYVIIRHFGFPTAAPTFSPPLILY